MSDVMEAIEAALIKKKISAAKASKLAVGHPALIKNMRLQRGDQSKRYNFDAVAALAKVLDLELYLGPPRELTPPVELRVEDDPDFTLLSHFDVEASAGHGHFVDQIIPNGDLAFRTDWLKANSISASHSVLLRAKGNSMEPLIYDKDMLLIDRSKTSVGLDAGRPDANRARRKEAIFVVEIGGELRVKILRRPDKDRLVMFSENIDTYAPEVFSKEDINTVRIIGRVMWWGHVAA